MHEDEARGRSGRRARDGEIVEDREARVEDAVGRVARVGGGVRRGRGEKRELTRLERVDREGEQLGQPRSAEVFAPHTRARVGVPEYEEAARMKRENEVATGFLQFQYKVYCLKVINIQYKTSNRHNDLKSKHRLNHETLQI